MEEIDPERGRGSPKALPKATGAPAMVRTVFRALLIWLLMMAAESVHGALRTWFLAPIVGDFRARQIGALVGSAIILVFAYLFIEWIGADDPRALWSVGFLWLGWTLSFEFALGRFAFGYSWPRIFEDYDIFKGGLLLFGVVFMALSPFVASSLRRRAGRATGCRM